MVTTHTGFGAVNTFGSSFCPHGKGGNSYKGDEVRPRNYNDRIKMAPVGTDFLMKRGMIMVK